MGKFDFDLVKGKTIFLASLPFFSFEKQTKEHILFQAQPSKKKKKQSTLSKAKLIATFQSKILIHRQMSERQTSETTNIGTTKVGKFKPQNDKHRNDKRRKI